MISQTVAIWTGIWLVFLSLFTALVGVEVYYLTPLLLRQWQKRRKRSSHKGILRTSVSKLISAYINETLWRLQQK